MKALLRRLFCLAGLGLLPVLAPGAPTISGNITDASTLTGLNNIDLDAYDAAGNSVTLTGGASASNGSYTMTLPAAGTYTVRADPGNSTGYVDQYWNHVFLPSQATTITVADSSVISGINFSLAHGVNISGTVRANGLAVSGISVDVYTPAGERLTGANDSTANDGTYSVGALPPGTYYVRARPSTGAGQWYAPIYYGQQYDRSLATPLVVASIAIQGIDIDLVPAGTMSGTVTGVGGAPLAGLDTDVLDSTGADFPLDDTTNASGAYSIALPAGQYYIRVDPTPAQGYPRVYYPNAINHQTAQLVTIAVGQNTPNISFSLPLAGTLTGRVRKAADNSAIPNIPLDCYDPAGTRLDFDPISAADGTFTVTNVLPGTYTMRADPDDTQGWMKQYYDHQADSAAANPIALGAGSTFANINFDLAPAGWITGTVFGPADALVPGIDLDVYDAVTGVQAAGDHVTDASGVYTWGPLPPGQYKIRVDPTIAQGYPRLYYPAAVNSDLGTTLTVTAGLGTSGIDFHLPRAGTFSGTVTAAANQAPIAGIGMDCYDAAGNRVDFTITTNASGIYQTGPLAPGQYRMRADPTKTQGYMKQYYQNQTDLDHANPINVAALSDTGSIDFALQPAGWIEGTVITEQFSAIPGVVVDLLDGSTGTLLAPNDTTDATGFYRIGPLTPGNYKVRCDPAEALGLGMQFYSGKINFETAATVPVLSGQGTSSIDFIMPAGGGVSGTVSLPTAQGPVAGALVSLYTADNLTAFGRTTQTDALGRYHLGSVPSGSWKLKADGGLPAYQVSYYGQAVTPQAASAFTVSGGATTPAIDITLIAVPPFEGSAWMTK